MNTAYRATMPACMTMKNLPGKLLRKMFLMNTFRKVAEERIRAAMEQLDGGEGGIRTPGGVASTTVFETAAFNHSATSPFIKTKTLFNPQITQIYADFVIIIPGPFLLLLKKSFKSPADSSDRRPETTSA